MVFEIRVSHYKTLQYFFPLIENCSIAVKNCLKKGFYSFHNVLRIIVVASGDYLEMLDSDQKILNNNLILFYVLNICHLTKQK